MKKIKIEDSATISRPFKIMLGFIALCVVFMFIAFVGSEAKPFLFVFTPWEPTATADAKVNTATYQTYSRAPSDYLISYTYTVNGKNYNDSDTIQPKDYSQQRTVAVTYKKADPSVNKLALSTNNALTFIGAAVVFAGILSGMALLSAYYFANWRPKNPKRVKRICANVIYAGVAIMLVSFLL